LASDSFTVTERGPRVPVTAGRPGVALLNANPFAEGIAPRWHGSVVEASVPTASFGYDDVLGPWSWAMALALTGILAGRVAVRTVLWGVIPLGAVGGGVPGGVLDLRTAVLVTGGTLVLPVLLVLPLNGRREGAG
jgi:hypothetical protein